MFVKSQWFPPCNPPTHSLQRRRRVHLLSATHNDEKPFPWAFPRLQVLLLLMQLYCFLLLLPTKSAPVFHWFLMFLDLDEKTHMPFLLIKLLFTWFWFGRFNFQVCVSCIVCLAQMIELRTFDTWYLFRCFKKDAWQICCLFGAFSAGPWTSIFMNIYFEI